MPTRILLVEDHSLVRSGIRALLESNPDVKVVGEAGDGREAVELCKTLQPEVVLMDVAMPGLNGVEATRQLNSAQPEIRVVMLSMYGDRQYVLEAIKAGAAGYLLKSAAHSELLTAIHSVVQGRRYLSPPLAEMVMDDYAKKGHGPQPLTELDKVSAREREVLQLIAEGKASSEVATILHISVRTVDTHRYNIMEKLNIHSIAGLTKFAIRHGLCPIN
jgi:two-component system, NarL family, response regulator NreC